MKNFIYRFISSIILGTLFLTFNIFGGNYFYILIILVLLLGLKEIIKINNIKIKIFIFLIFSLFLYSFYNLRFLPNGLFLTLWCLILTWTTDIAAFVFGKLFGKRKIGIISPNKTYIGFISGIFFSQISYFTVNIFFEDSYYLNLTKIIIIQLFISLAVIIGDLFFSFLKRRLAIKDFSKIIPGHGGLFDRIDGLVFSIIFFNIIFSL